MSGVKIEGVGKSYGGPAALESVDLDLPGGRISVVLGPSGCGKTTLLRILAGLTIPDTGTVTIDDEVVNDPQVLAAGGLVDVPDQGSTVKFPATPVDFHGTPWEVRAMAPEHGEHTEEVLRELGRSDEQIAALREKGAVV